MKKLTTLLLLSSLFINCISQQTNLSPSFTKKDYLNKSKNEKKTAWILAGGGLAMSSVTLAITANNGTDAISNFLVTVFNLSTNNNDNDDKTSLAGVLFFIGAVSTITSVPLFISASKNKRKAMNMSFNNQPVPQMQNNSLVYRAIPSLKLKISL